MTGYLIINDKLDFIIDARSTLKGAEQLAEKLNNLPERYNPRKRKFTIKECKTPEDWEKFGLIATLSGQFGTSLGAIKESLREEFKNSHQDEIFNLLFNYANLRDLFRETKKIGVYNGEILSSKHKN